MLYLTSNFSSTPSWLPRWDRPMLFRNPFRFGKALPWKPAEGRKSVWSIDKIQNVLSLAGFIVDHIKYATSYDESIFSNSTIQCEKGREDLTHVWQRILTTIGKSHVQ
ncbi:hypothetical protein BKA65DRAFT_508041 [Rhexocercosporidium sp. MPI-PUGE-AT-0058]|nr:hypothetical protein BKA65DRAFT_508041 [Rhexocercosporidium sp. MPI-PUGE-AT-0058]